MNLDIISRADWGARHSRGFVQAPLPASEVWLHHSATLAPDLVPPWDDDYAAVRTLERIGQERFGAGISYTFLITPAGLVFEGHGVDRRGAHTKGHNTTGRAICWVGNYDTAEPTPAMVAATVALLQHGRAAGWWAAPQLAGGHRDVPGAATACPGRHAHAAIPTINRLAGAAGPPTTIGGDTAVIENIPVRGAGGFRRILPVGSSSEITARAWLSLVADGPAGAAARVFWQSDAGGIDDDELAVTFRDGWSTRQCLEAPDGTTQLVVQYVAPDGAVVALEAASK